jgi:hypothetical protein
MIEVFRLSQAHNAAQVQERRRRRVDDVVKRNAYRKAHGLDQEQGFGGWVSRTTAPDPPESTSTDGKDGSPSDARKEFVRTA